MEYKFTHDWFSPKIPGWVRIKEGMKWDVNSKLTVIEIGSFEGRSACWILNNLLSNADSRLYCIDTFEGSLEHDSTQTEHLYDRFNHNIKCTGKENLVEVMVGNSEDKLVELITREIKADLIYIDGSHLAKDVLSDAVMSWKLLKTGGVMIFDDYLWTMPNSNNISMNPKLAIDNFVNVYYQDIICIPNVQNAQFYILKK